MGKPSTPPQLAYAEMFRNATRAAASTDIVPSASITALLPGCFKHCNTEGPEFATLTTNGVTLEAALLSWFFGENTVPNFVREDCVGFNCGPGCPQ